MKREKLIEMQIEKFKEILAKDLEEGKINEVLYNEFIFILNEEGIYNTDDFNHGLSFAYRLLRSRL